MPYTHRYYAMNDKENGSKNSGTVNKGWAIGLAAVIGIGFAVESLGFEFVVNIGILIMVCIVMGFLISTLSDNDKGGGDADSE